MVNALCRGPSEPHSLRLADSIMPAKVCFFSTISAITGIKGLPDPGSWGFMAQASTIMAYFAVMAAYHQLLR
nr:hypothetical protein CFP56_28517 [Quercus suber]